MHIADGILPLEITIPANVIAISLVYAGGRNLKSDEVPRMGIFAAALFIVSLIQFPLGGTSIHLGLYGLAGIIFGLRTIPIIFVDLLFQSLIFQHGGLLTIGTNTLTMSSGALIARFIWIHIKRYKPLAGFLCGFFGIIIPALLMSLLFIMVDYGKGMAFILAIYIPAALVEGFITSFIPTYFKKTKPELIP